MRPLLAALLTLAAGLAVADDHVVEAGKFADLKYKVQKGDILKLRVSPPPVQRADGLEPGRLIFAGEPGKTYAVRGYVVNFDRKTFDEIDDTVTFGGKAGPKPGPDPKPDPKPDPVTGTLYVVVVEESYNRTPEFARVLGDAAFWDGLKGRDVRWRVYDKDSPDAARLGYLPHANRVGLPAVLLMRQDGTVFEWAVRRLTATADVDNILKAVGR